MSNKFIFDKTITGDLKGESSWKSPSNIALVKYWGKKDLQIPKNPSLSFTLSNCFTTTNGSNIVTITFPTPHSFVAGDIILFSDFSTATNSNYSASDFDDIKYMVTSVPADDEITITMDSNEGGAGATTSGGITFFQYYHVGPPDQVGVFGYGISQWGGTTTNPQTTTLNGGLNNDAFGTGGSGTTINVASTTGFPSSGTNFIQVGTEEISYTGITATSFTGITRAVRGTTRAAHSTSATVTNHSGFSGWGKPASTRAKVEEQGRWSIDNLVRPAIW